MDKMGLDEMALNQPRVHMVKDLTEKNHKLTEENRTRPLLLLPSAYENTVKAGSSFKPLKLVIFKRP